MDTGNWKSHEIFPPFNIPRVNHSSCATGDCISVIGAQSELDDAPRSSIETLRISLNDDLSIAFPERSWSLVELEHIYLRSYPFVCAIDPNSFLISSNESTEATEYSYDS